MTLQSPSLRMAVIGVGALGRHHARILSTLPGVELVAVADPEPLQGRAVAEAVGCDWTHDYRTLLSSIDAASVVVPTFLHAAVASDLLKRGIHVLVEKPLAPSVADGEQLCRLADEHHITLQVGHIERFNPAFRDVAAWSRSPKYIRAERYSPYPFRSLDIGVVLDLMIHDIDLVLALVEQPPVKVEAFGVSLVGGEEDCAQSRLHFPGGCVADLSVNRVSPQVKRALQVWSEQGVANADLQSRRVTYFEAGPKLLAGQLPFELALHQSMPVAELKEQMFTQFVSVRDHQSAADDALTLELAEFVATVRTGARPTVSGRAGLKALNVATEILDRIARHRWDGTTDGRCGPDLITSMFKGSSPVAPRDIGRAA